MNIEAFRLYIVLAIHFLCVQTESIENLSLFPLYYRDRAVLAPLDSDRTTTTPATNSKRRMASSTVQSDTSLGPLFFWREFEEPYGFLSQWYESSFDVDGVTYLTAEMWMMVQKARLFGDEVT